MTIRAAVYRRAVVATSALLALAATNVTLATHPWDDDAAVQEVLELRRQGIAAMTSVGPREEIVVPGPNARDAGKRIHRRFTDVFRKENGEWRHDLRHANVISTE
jgi:hypothetical protein